jgi:hypothetical protein
MEVDNEEYKKRRAEALQKPGAVVGNVTYRWLLGIKNALLYC